MNAITALKFRIAELGYDYRGVPDNYDESMRCENCRHFKAPYYRDGRNHGDCTEIDLGLYNEMKIYKPASIPGEYICEKYEESDSE